MSGHSKWATIKRQKGATDAKRGQLFTKLSSTITLAVREGGGSADINSNFKLRLAVDRARSFNMPKDNIERAIERAAGKQAGDMIEAVYEGFGPGGAAVIVEAVTDNRQRTFSELKNIFDKNGGSLGSQGTVSYLFSRVGEVIVSKKGKTEDDILSVVFDLDGIEDVQDEDEVIIVYSEPTKLFEVKKALEDAQCTIESAELIYRPIVTNTASDDEVRSKLQAFIEKIEDSGDVQNVYTNVE